MLKVCKKVLEEGNPSKSWPWKQNLHKSYHSCGCCNDSWNCEQLKKRVTDKLFEKKLDFEPKSTSGKVGKVIYHYNSWVTSVYMVCMHVRNCREETSQIESLFESNLGSFGYFKCSIALWLPLDPNCKGNLLTWAGWVLQA